MSDKISEVMNTLSRSAILHGLVGAALALPVFFAALEIGWRSISMLFGIYNGSGGSLIEPWGRVIVLLLILSVVPVPVGSFLYFVRCLVTRKPPDGRGVVAYAGMSASAALLALALAMLIGWSLEWLLKAGSLGMPAGIIIAGFIVGVGSLTIDRWLHKSR